MVKPVDMRTLGGVSYNANIVKDAIPANRNGGRNVLIFNTGEKLEYSDQAPGAFLNVSEGQSKGLIFPTTEITMTGFKNATLTSSKESVLEAHLYENENVKVDAAANGSKIFGDYNLTDKFERGNVGIVLVLFEIYPLPLF